MNSNAQKLDVGFSSGTGLIYFFENKDSNIDIDYKSPVVLSAHIKYTPINSYFGLKLKYQNLVGKVKGDDWQHIYVQTPFTAKFDGYIENSALLFELEHLKDLPKYSFGYSFGLGTTKEKIYFNSKKTDFLESNYMVLNLSGTYIYNITNKLGLKFEPSILWNDPINSLNFQKHNMAGEDLNLFFQIGVNYRIK
jgi:preprotein translocase subunit Sec61beta